MVMEKKGKFAKEARKKENSKEFGQPVKAKLDEILYNHGIDRAGAFCGAIDGNACRRLMGNAASIIGQLKDHVLNCDHRVEGITDMHIEQVCEGHIHLLHALDGFLSGLLTKRFHITDDIKNKTRQFRDKSMELERYLQFSITPKSHIIESHACQQMEALRGIGNLDESCGERNHQVQTGADNRYGTLCDFGYKEKLKARDESIDMNPFIKSKMKQISVKRQKDTTTDRVTKTKRLKLEKLQVIANERQHVLEYNVPNDKLEKIADKVKAIYGATAN